MDIGTFLLLQPVKFALTPFIQVIASAAVAVRFDLPS
jgi:hypothetical protein